MSTIKLNGSKSYLNKEHLYNNVIPLPSVSSLHSQNNYIQSHALLSIVITLIVLFILSGLIFVIIKGIQISNIEQYNIEMTHEINTLIAKLNDSKEKSEKLHKSIDELNKNINQIEIQCNNTFSLLSKLQNDVNYKQKDITKLTNTIQLVESNNQLIKSIPNANDDIDIKTVHNSLHQSIDDKANKVNALNSLITYLQSEIQKRALGIQINPKYKKLGIDSVLIQQEDQLNFLNLWIANGRSMDYILLYRGSEHGFSPKVFHQFCNNKRSTLVLVNTEIGIIGGYTVALWNGWEAHMDNKAFVFNLKKERRYDIVPSMVNKAIYTDGGILPDFGKGDLDVGSKVVTSVFPQTYGNKYPSLDLTDGRKQLSYDEIEVFHVVNKIKDY